MSRFEIIVTILLSIGFCVMSYRGVFGWFLWRWTRIPFAFLGGLLISVGMNGVPEMPVTRDEEVESEIAEHREASDVEDATNDDDRSAKHLWSLKGFTPTDILNQCVMQATSGATDDPEIEGWDFSQEPKESLSTYRARKAAQRA